MKFGNMTIYTCFQKLSTIAVFFSVCISVLYIDRIFNYKCQEKEHFRKVIQDDTILDTRNQRENIVKADFPQRKEFTVKEEIMDPLRIPYQYLLGSHPVKKRYLSIGIASVKRKMGNYLMGAMKSIFSQSSAKDLEETLLVIYLTNVDSAENMQTAKEIEETFHPHIKAGNLIVICSSINNYPTLDGLKKNYNDSEDRVKYRSKQNVDYAFLVNFCSSLSEYYLMLEDDVVCAEQFLTSIKMSLQDRDPSWTTISYSKLGFIGKLFHAEDLPKLARFLLLFYDEMPGDWLLDHFHQSKSQPEIIRIKPSLFQHMGSFSSFQGLKKNLKDDDFTELSANAESLPPASCFTNLEVHEQYGAENVCKGGGAGYFWGKNVEAGKYFLIIFQDPVNIKKIHIATGLSEYEGDFLHSGFLQFGKMKNEENGMKTCIMFNNVGSFKNGKLERSTVDPAIGNHVDCLRIQVTASQQEWLIIKYVRL